MKSITADQLMGNGLVCYGASSDVPISSECKVTGTDLAEEISVGTCWLVIVANQSFIPCVTASSIRHTLVGCFALLH